MITPSAVTTAADLGLNLNGIMWCDATINPGLYGCSKVSPACTNCYAEEMAARIVRMGGDEPGATGAAVRYAQGVNDAGRWTGRVTVDPRQIAPAFAKLPRKPNRIRRVFVTSMADLFHRDVPYEYLAVVFGAMAARPWITFQVLTKRPERAAEFYAWLGRDGRDEWEAIINAADAYDGDGNEPPLLAPVLYVGQWPIPNVWIGTTVEDQQRADERIPHLLRVPAAVRFLSVEPMLGPIDVAEYLDLTADEDRAVFARAEWQPVTADDQREMFPKIAQVIIGSESDGNRPGARETREAWVLDLVDQCDAARVAVFVKQIAINGRLCSLPMVRGRVRAEFP